MSLPPPRRRREADKDEPSAKRACRRLVASTSTVCRVPAETWIVICANLFFSPHTVFRIMMACKHVWRALSKDDGWWKAFADRVILYQECLDHSNIRHRLVHLTQRFRYNPRQAIQLVCSPRCSMCGSRFGHFIFRPLRCRLCIPCLQSALVSNRVLALRYGIDVADFVVAYVAAGGVLIPLDLYQHRTRLQSMFKLSRDPVDFAGYAPVMFLARADVERVLGVRLDPDALVAQRARTAAAHALAARVRRTYVLTRLRAAASAPHVRMHRVRNALVDLANNELQRTLNPVCLPGGFVLGGPFCAAAGGRHPQPRRRHLTVDEVNTASRHMYAPFGFAGGSSSMWM